MHKNVLAFSKNKLLLFFLYLIPVCLLLWFIANFGVEFPIMDEWAIVPLFTKVANDQVSFGDFFNQHNEHRIMFIKIIIVILAFISQWNINYELFVNILLSIINFYVVYRIYLISRSKYNKWIGHLVNLITCFTILSWCHYEILLSGLGMVWLLTNTCVLLAVLTISGNNQQLSTTIRLSLAAIWCFIASFSSAHGLFSWLALLPSITVLPGSLEQKIKRLSLWIGLWLGTCLIYSIGYQKNPDYYYSILLKKPLAVLAYFLSILGAPLASGSIESLILGIILFLNFTLFAGYCAIKFKSKFTHQAIPWFSLGLFALLFAMVTTVGRGLSNIQITGDLSSLKFAAVTSRYLSVSALLLISLLQIWQLFIFRNRTDSLGQLSIKGKTKFVIYLVAGIIFYLTLVKSLYAIPHAKYIQNRRQNAETCLDVVHFLELSLPATGCLWDVYPSAFLVQEYAEALEEMKFRNFANNLDFLAKPAQVYGVMEEPQLTDDDLSIKKNENKNILFSGWAVLPNQVELPKLVLLSYQGQKSFFTTAYVAFPRPDIAQTLNSVQYTLSGWLVDYPTKSMPLGEQIIQAWVYDKQGEQFVKLQGEVKVLVKE